MNYKKHTFLAVLVLFITSIYAQEYHFKTYTTDDGLSNNSVMDIENDKFGALWIATWDGLNYFDGNKFTVYKHRLEDENSIAGNEIFQILKDKNGDIWVRTDKSVSKYIGNGKFKNYFFTEKPRKLYLSENKIPMISFSENNYLELKESEFVPSSKNKVYIKDNSIFKNLLLSKRPNLIINDVYKDEDSNSILFASQDNGLFVVKTTEDNFEIINYKTDLYNPLGINSNEVEKIHKDVFGNIWLGFKDGGISLIQKAVNGVTTILPHPKDFPHLPTETIRAIGKDGNNILWLGYYTKGLYFFSNKTNCFLPFVIPKSAENKDWNRVRSLYKTSDNALWVGTYAGIIRIYKNKITYYQAEDFKLFPNNRTYSFFEKDDELWVSCWGGVAKINLKTLQFKPFKNQEALNIFHIRKIYAHKHKLLLATKNNGLIIYDCVSVNYKQITEEEGLSGNSTFSILYDKTSENFWISSLGGITILDKNFKVIHQITEQDGLPSHMVYGLLDTKNQVWASTTKGITKINKKEFKTKRINPDEDWQAKEFSEGAYYKDSEGVLYFGGVKGLSFFKPEHLKVSSNLPILKVEIEDSKENFTVEKQSSDNFLKVKITPISYVNNFNNKVLYRLQGYDKNWKIVDKQNIFYKKLPAGDFIFQVKNSLDFSEKNMVSYIVKINKPFYKSNGFLGGLGALFLLGGIYFIYRKNKLSKQYKRKLELEIEKRTSTIESQKTELLNLHNSIKNNEFEIDKFKTFVLEKFKKPLTIILENVSSSLIQPDKKEIITEQTKYLMNKVIQWNYLEDVTNLGDYKKVLVSANTIKNSFLQYNQQFADANIVYKVVVKNKFQFLEIDLVRYKLLIQYLFNNILKFNKKDTQLQVKISSEENNLTINLLSDNDLLKDNMEYVQKFSPYYKAFSKILEDINGQVIIDKSEGLKIDIKIPANQGIIEKHVNKTVNSVSLTNIDLPDDKTIFLVHCNKDDFNVASCILESEENHLVFESNENIVYKLLHKTERFNVLILYNVLFSRKLVDLLSSIDNKNRIPTIYISEKIDYFLQDKIASFNINEVIQLPASKKFVQSKLQRVLTHFSSEHTTKIKEKTTSPNEKLVHKAEEIIRKNYGNTNFNVDYLANELSVSRIKCYRMFKEVLKQSPSDVIIQYRMKMAVELINSTNLNVSEISLECGFNDPKYFGKVFKKYYGVNPKNYKSD